MSIGSADAGGHRGFDELELLHLVTAVEAVAARVPLRDHELVPLLPGAQGRHGHSHHSGRGADAVDRAFGSARTLHLLHTIYSSTLHRILWLGILEAVRGRARQQGMLVKGYTGRAEQPGEGRMRPSRRSWPRQQPRPGTPAWRSVSAHCYKTRLHRSRYSTISRRKMAPSRLQARIPREGYSNAAQTLF